MEQLSLFSTSSKPSKYTVSQINSYLRDLINEDDNLQNVWVFGEISNLSQPRSGHVYFTLKDDKASLRCVIWRSNAARLGVTLQNGLAVEAHGSVSVYERDGQYQLYVKTLRPAGEGMLYQEFLRLKASLEAEGLFDDERKRPIPEYPHRIGVVTSATGAALQDMEDTLRARFPLADVYIAPASVQGDSAPREIIQALQLVNQYAEPDVILLGRGGGSLEDLWAFNDEGVVRAVVLSEAPIITGIGHETDFTLCDFAADRRAPTPTGAAVMATPDISDIKTGLTETIKRLNYATMISIDHLRNLQQDSHHRLERASPMRIVRNNQQRLDELIHRSQRSLVHAFQIKKTQIQGTINRLASLSPKAVMARGYALVEDPDGSLIKTINAVKNGQQVNIQLHDGQIHSRVESTSPCNASSGSANI